MAPEPLRGEGDGTRARHGARLRPANCTSRRAAGRREAGACARGGGGGAGWLGASRPERGSLPRAPGSSALPQVSPAPTDPPLAFPRPAAA